jgi:hypothetical protein
MAAQVPRLSKSPGRRGSFERIETMDPSAQAAATVPRRRWFDRRTPLPSEVGQHRTTAFIYGNILVLAAVVQVSLHPITGRGAVTVLAGIALALLALIIVVTKAVLTH